MLVNNYMHNLNNSMDRLSKLQTQLALNRKFASISDDPVSAIYSMQASFRLDRLERYQKSVDMAQNWLTQAETCVMEINDVYKSIYETVISAATDVNTDNDRAKMAEYVKQMRDHVLQTLNTSFGNKYIFAGYNTTGAYSAGLSQTPFSADDDGHIWLNGVDLTAASPGDADLMLLQEEMLQFWVGNGLTMDVQINGADLVGLGEDNLYSLLDNLYKVLTDTTGVPLDNMVEALQPFITKLQDKQEFLLAEAASIGGRANRLEMMADRYTIDFLNYTQMKSNAEDADQAELIMWYKMAESVYKAALSTGSYIIQQTLMDFLR